VESEKTPRERAEDLIRLLVPDWRPTLQQVLWAIRIVFAFVIVLSILSLLGRPFDITLWDWTKLLLVPAVIAAGGLWFNAQQQEREQRIANERAQDEALQGYLDGMSQLLTDKERPLHRAQPGDTLSTVARARTLTVLARLNSERKGSVVRFLYEAGLINKDHLIVDLQRSRDLRGADLSATYLTNSSLCRADLSRVDLRWTFMPGANLSYANLSGANLSDAGLTAVNLSLAVLDGANLSGAYLYSADLSSARGVTQEQLDQAASLVGATMPNGQKYEEWIKEDEEGRRLYISNSQRAYLDSLEDEESREEDGENE
jgi:uncharacterized protein YjbI with pentapeptide repeats